MLSLLRPSLSRLITTSSTLCTSHPRAIYPMADVIIPEPSSGTDTSLHITSHNQYNAPETLSPTTVSPSPLTQFHTWFTAAQTSVSEPEAVSLATATPSGVPSVRFVLFKELDACGFVFFTNYTSRKSAELLANPRAALAFYWREAAQQVRVVGRAERVSQEESAAYFRSRPAGSQVGAWASRQSSVVAEGAVAQRLESLKEKFGGEVPVPDFWGGWRIVPDEVEFWAGKPSRLHDRVRYLRVAGSPEDAPQWTIEQLAP